MFLYKNQTSAHIYKTTSEIISTTTIIAAITSASKKRRLPTHVRVDCDFLENESIILLEQIRTIDKYRLGNYIGKFSDETIREIDQAIKISFGISFLEGLKDG